MLARLRHPGWLIAVQLAACWPVWRWYVLRMTDGSDEPLGILALITAMILIWREWRESIVTIQGESVDKTDLVLPALLLFVYAFTCSITPPLIRAVFVVTALSVTSSQLILGVRFHLALSGLLLLSLPVVSSLQFYLGYPLRVVCGYLALPVLGLAGFPVSIEGTNLRCGDLLVCIDAPCSGIRMLWTGLYLTLTLACLYRLKTQHVCLVCGISIVLILLANTLRAASLFLIEVLPIQRYEWLHDMTGLVIFTSMGVTMILVMRHLAGVRPCATPASS